MASGRSIDSINPSALQVQSKYNYQLSTLFSSAFLDAVARDAHHKNFNYLLKESGVLNSIKSTAQLSGVLSSVYDHLLSHYRCEYIYKNVIATNILLGRHSLNTSTLLTEFRVGNSKADVVIINGTSTVYEIKTELDSLDRLENQINSYLNVFDKVFVVTHAGNVEKMEALLDVRVGIIVLSKQHSLRTEREAISNKANVSSATIFDSLQMKEYKVIIEQVYGCVPTVPNTQIYTECRKLFSKLSPIEAHDHMLRVLRERRFESHQLQLIKDAPRALKMLFLSKKLSKGECSKFSTLLF